MALISIGEVKEIAARQLTARYAKSAAATFNESLEAEFGEHDVFLSHSYTDRVQVRELKKFLENFDCSVYVDWIVDRQLDRNNVTPATAAKLRDRMNNCKSLLFATTENSTASVWMPWELGYFDGRNGRIAIMPLTLKKLYGNNYQGPAYLGLYPYVVREHSTSGRDMLWVHRSPKEYMALEEWIAGATRFKTLP